MRNRGAQALIKADEVINAAFDRGKAKQVGLSGGDDDSLTRYGQIRGRCLILDHAGAGSFCAQMAQRR